MTPSSVRGGRGALAVALLLLLGPLSALLALQPADVGPARARAGAVPASATCRVELSRRVGPLTPALDDTVTFTLNIAAPCERDERPLSIVLVVDASDEMSEVLLDELVDTLREAVLELPLEDAPHIRLGVVSFADGAEVHQRLTNNRELLVAGLNEIDQTRPTSDFTRSFGKALDEARRMLAGVPAGRQVVLLASAGFNPGRCVDLRSKASETKQLGIVLVTACHRANCELRCLADVASTSRFAFETVRWGLLDERLAELAYGRGPFHPVERVMVAEELSEELIYLGGGEPTSGSGNRLEWAFRALPRGGVTRTYQALAATCGRPFRPSDGLTATLRYHPVLYPGQRTDQVFHPDPTINPPLEVVCPPTVTPTPTGTPTPDAVRTPTPTRPAPVTTVVYLPSVRRYGCAPRAGALDLVVAVDVSGSMSRPLPGTGHDSRWSAARALTARAIDTLRPGDRVALLAYGFSSAGSAPSHAPRWLTALTDDHTAAKAALERLPRLPGAATHQALARALDRLARDGRPSARHAVILLTDGEPRELDRSALTAAGRRAQANDTNVYAVLLDPDAEAVRLAPAVRHPGDVLVVGRRPPSDWLAALAPLAVCAR